MPVEFITQHKKPISPTERKFSFLFRLAEDAFKVPVFRCKHCGGHRPDSLVASAARNGCATVHAVARERMEPVRSIPTGNASGT